MAWPGRTLETQEAIMRIVSRVLSAALVLCTTAAPSQADISLRLSHEDLALQADAIVIGHAVGSVSR
jgi:hypothetical protein